MLRETEFAKQRALMRNFEKHALDQGQEIIPLWYYLMVPYRSYVKGSKINQDLATVWLDR
jgi:hypothetical protein